MYSNQRPSADSVIQHSSITLIGPVCDLSESTHSKSAIFTGVSQPFSPQIHRENSTAKVGLNDDDHSNSSSFQLAADRSS